MTGSPKMHAAARRVLETGCAETVALPPAREKELRELEHSIFLMRRSCLNCGTHFVAQGRFNRLCPACRRKSA